MKRLLLIIVSILLIVFPIGYLTLKEPQSEPDESVDTVMDQIIEEGLERNSNECNENSDNENKNCEESQPLEKEIEIIEEIQEKHLQ